MELEHFARIFFKDKNTYNNMSPEEIKNIFFIFNKCMARKSPLNADILNKKFLDKNNSMDTWFNICKNTTNIPDWFLPNWRLFKKKKDDNKLDEMDKLLLSFYQQEEQPVIEKDITVIKKKTKKKKI